MTVNIFIVRDWLEKDCESFKEMISENEKKYLEQCSNKENSIQSLCLLKSFLGEVNTYRNYLGKPFLDNDSRYINWSHTDDVWVLAVSEYGNVGIDVENLDIFYDDSLYSWVLHEDELRHLGEGSFFSEIWTRKESVLKCSGEGIHDNMCELNTYGELNASVTTFFLSDLVISVCSEKFEDVILNES